MRKILEEFKTFAVKGNAVDLAVGIVIGAAFGKIVSSLVEDVVMPPFGLLIGGIDFSNNAWVLREAYDGLEAVTLNYGMFINIIIEFLIIAWALFFVVKLMNRLAEKEKRKGETTPPKQEVLLTEIRDILKQK